MANALYYRDKLDEALELYEKALKVLAMDEEGNQIPMSVTTNNMANIVYEQGNREKALELYESALRIQKRVQGIEHPSVAENICQHGESSVLQEQAGGNIGSSTQGAGYL
jgi:tetratricopeptide (TPR) repeat protein